jgi:glucose-6-phosphate isomerase
MISIDFTNLMSDAIGANGLSKKDFAVIDADKLTKIIDDKRHTELAFIDLLDADIGDIKKAGEFAGKFDNLIILGIGGSALGPRTILDSLSPLHNYSKKPRVFIYDNVDPMTLKSILAVVDLKRTVINVITKSGSTAETLASFMILWKMILDAGLKPAEHIIITTDPERGNLRKIANENGITALAVPPAVGGRYSVLSAVGLLLAEAAGIDADVMLKGAKDINERCLNADLWQNPAMLFASAMYLMHKEKGRSINVMFPYADRLKPFSEWFCQLWAESLGKDGQGLTPYPSVGTTDQHSQLQLWMQGPQDKVVVFIAVDDYGTDLIMPDVFHDIEGMSYLGGHGLQELIKIEQEASEIALTKNNRPSVTVRIPIIDAYHLGQLFQFFELATAITGYLIGINPFDQPGVEEGKNLTYGMMGKHGYEEKRQEFEKYRQRGNRLAL